MSDQHLSKRPAVSAEPENPKGSRTAILLTLVYAAIAVFVRMIPYAVRPPNVAANGALSIYGGSRTPVWFALPVQLSTLVVSDLLLYKVFRWEPFNLAVYASFIIYLLLGRAFLRGNDSLGRIATVTFVGSLQFFLITNFAEWLQFSGIIGTGQRTYDSTLAGLLTCLSKGLPFFGFTAAGDLGFGAVMFGAEAWLYGEAHATKPVGAHEEVAS